MRELEAANGVETKFSVSARLTEALQAESPRLPAPPMWHRNQPSIWLPCTYTERGARHLTLIPHTALHTHLTLHTHFTLHTHLTLHTHNIIMTGSEQTGLLTQQVCEIQSRLLWREVGAGVSEFQQGRATYTDKGEHEERSTRKRRSFIITHLPLSNTKAILHFFNWLIVWLDH